MRFQSRPLSIALLMVIAPGNCSNGMLDRVRIVPSWSGAAGWVEERELLTLGIPGADPWTRRAYPAIPAATEDRAPGHEDPIWLARVQRELAAREYEASRNDVGLQAPNRAHNLRTYFEPQGIRVVDRTAADAPELLALRARDWGRPGHMAPVEAGVVNHDGARVEISRPGIVEWYENSAAGLEHGFTLAHSPAGAGPLVVTLGVCGAEPMAHADGVTFRSATGRSLEYAKLAVFDANGATLPARLETADAELRITVDDREAVYPVTIDPLLTSTADGRLESNQAAGQMGVSVAGAGDVNGDGHGDVIVGATQFDAGETDEGAAFVFLGGPSGIANGGPASASATLQSNQASALMGYSVAGAGDVNGDGYADVIVGAYGYDAGETNEGAAFVFLGSASGIANGSPASAATLQSNQSGALMGYSVAGAGDVNGDGYADVIVGAHYYDAGEADEGAAFVFLGSAGGIAGGSPASAAATLQSNQEGANLGVGVAGVGDVNGDGYADVIVGAWLYDAGETDEGAAFVYLGSATGIANGGPATAAATLQSNQTSALLGLSVARAGDVNGDGYADVIVGAHFYDLGEANEGAVFVFLGSPTGIASGSPATAATTLESNQAGAQMGAGVAGAGDVDGDGYADVIVGANLYDAGGTDAGAAFVYLGSASGIATGSPATAAAMLPSNQAGAHMGYSVAGAGDVNSDGYADVIVGAFSYDAGQADEGAAFVYLGGARGIVSGSPASAAATLEANQAGARLGWSVAGAGDVNGDGYADVIVGTDRYDAGEADEGAAFVFLGSPSGIASGNPTSTAAMLQSNQVGALMGFSVAGAGDVNGDGYADVIVGAHAYDSGETNEGAAFVFLGGPAGIPSGSPASAAAILESNQAGALMGARVAGAGDVNGDGYADVIVGADQYDAGEADEGAAFVFLGGPSGIASGNPASAAATLESNQASARMGVERGRSGRRQRGRLRRRNRRGRPIRRGRGRRGSGLRVPGGAERDREREPGERRGDARVEPGRRVDGRQCGRGGRRQWRRLRRCDRRGLLLRRGRERRGSSIRLPGEPDRDREREPDERRGDAPVEPSRRVHGIQCRSGRRERRRLCRRDRRGLLVRRRPDGRGRGARVPRRRHAGPSDPAAPAPGRRHGQTGRLVGRLTCIPSLPGADDRHGPRRPRPREARGRILPARQTLRLDRLRPRDLTRMDRRGRNTERRHADPRRGRADPDPLPLAGAHAAGAVQRDPAGDHGVPQSRARPLASPLGPSRRGGHPHDTGIGGRAAPRIADGSCDRVHLEPGARDDRAFGARAGTRAGEARAARRRGPAREVS
jgi:hypothetical protein